MSTATLKAKKKMMRKFLLRASTKKPGPPKKQKKKTNNAASATSDGWTNGFLLGTVIGNSFSATLADTRTLSDSATLTAKGDSVAAKSHAKLHDMMENKSTVDTLDQNNVSCDCCDTGSGGCDY